MGRMIFDLTDEDRAALEGLRAQRGHRSQAETLRELIRQASSSGLPSPERQAEIRAEDERRQKVRPGAKVGGTGAVPVYERPKFSPQPKKGKAK